MVTDNHELRTWYIHSLGAMVAELCGRDRQTDRQIDPMSPRSIMFINPNMELRNCDFSFVRPIGDRNKFLFDWRFDWISIGVSTNNSCWLLLLPDLHDEDHQQQQQLDK